MPNQHPLLGYNKEEILHYAKSQLNNAMVKLELDDPEGAAWRIADALGALGFCCAQGTQGIDTHTGLGFKLGRVDDNTV